MLPESK